MTPTAALNTESIAPTLLHDATEPDDLGDRLDDCGPDAPYYRIIQCELSEEQKEAMADHTWLNDQINDGAMDDYSGEYVAVFRKTLLGHHRKPQHLRKEVSEATGIPIDQILTRFIDRNLDW